MNKIENIQIRITGSNGMFELKPDNYDIREMVKIVQQTENLLFPGDKKERPLISYRIEEGSVKNIFSTSMQAVIGFAAIISSINLNKNIDFLESNTAKAIEIFQDTAIKRAYEFEISTTLPNTEKLIINSKTSYIRNVSLWVESEFYFYGKITNAGGKDKANIHIFTEEFGTLKIETPQKFLEEKEENLLYKKFGIRVTGKQNIETGEMDKSNLRFLELIDYNNNYDEEYLSGLRKKAMGWIVNIDPENWLREIRGNNA